jgi:hypothetical protein
MAANIVETIRCLQNPEESYLFQNTPPVVPFLSRMNPVNT